MRKKSRSAHHSSSFSWLIMLRHTHACNKKNLRILQAKYISPGQTFHLYTRSMSVSPLGLRPVGQKIIYNHYINHSQNLFAFIEINFMWAAHQVHHSSEDYNLTTALRQSVVQKYTSWGFYLPLALGIPPSIFLVHIQFNLLYQFWIHTEVNKHPVLSGAVYKAFWLG